MYNGNVLILPDEIEKETPNGLIIPNTVIQQKLKGKVISVSEGYYDDKTGNFIKSIVKNNDNVFYKKDVGIEVEIDSNKYLIVKEYDILSIL